MSLNRVSGVAVLQYDAPFTFLGIAEDYDGNFGLGTLEVVTLSRGGTSPAQEFLDALDALDEQELSRAKTSMRPARRAPVMRK